jgi:hypothetical protein
VLTLASVFLVSPILVGLDHPEAAYEPLSHSEC